MPARSQAQARKMGALYSQGKISKRTLEEYTKGVQVSRLPERVGRKARRLKRGSRRGGRR